MAIKFKGDTTVAIINSIKKAAVDTVYRCFDSGVLLSNEVINHGDFVSWDGTKWIKRPDLSYLINDVEHPIEQQIENIAAVIPEGASSSNKLVTESGMEDALSAIGTGYTPKGNATVATLEALTGQSNGDMYIVTDSGTITAGTLEVTAGDSVAWDAENAVWYKTNQYATQQEHDALTTYAQNVAHSIAPEFDPTKTEDNPYLPNKKVLYEDGFVYECIVPHSGAWNAGHFKRVCISDFFIETENAAKKSDVFEDSANLYKKCSAVDSNYLSTKTALKVGKNYKIVFVPSSTFTYSDNLAIGTEASGSFMVDSFGSDINFVNGESYVIDNYNPTVDNLQYIRVVGHANDFSEVLVYEIQSNLKLVPKSGFVNTKISFIRKCSVFSENYFDIGETLSEKKKYRIVFKPNTSFEYSTFLAVGTGPASASMVDYLDENIDFVNGEDYVVENYIPSTSGLRYIRMLGTTGNFDSVDLYEVSEELNVSDSVKYLNTNVIRSNFVENGQNTNDENNLYWRFLTLPKGKYRIEFVASEDRVFNSIKIGSSKNSGSMKITLAENLYVSKDENFGFDFDLNFESEDALYYQYLYVMIDGADSISSIKIYKTENAFDVCEKIGEDGSFLTDRLVAINNAVKELKEVKECVDQSVSSLIELHEAGSTFTMTLPPVGEHDRALVRVGLHFESNPFTSDSSELYFGGACKKDFSDVRFFDSDGNMLRAQLGKVYNIGLYRDDRINGMVKVSSSGMIVSYSEENGILISVDNGETFTAIAGTASVTVNESAVYHRKGMYPIFVDSDENIYAYAGGILYKLLASDNYYTKSAIVDFSWVYNGNTIYPDIQNHGMDRGTDGKLYFGVYSVQNYVKIYVSVNNGSSFVSAYEKKGVDGWQHVHHIHANPNNNDVYIGVDDGASTWYGSHILKTNDGSTFVDVTENNREYRGRDYFPTYFGEDYFLGGGETYTMGSASIYRSKDLEHFDCAVKGLSGVRSFADFGNDSFIVCGMQQSTFVMENHILISTDKGASWESIFKKNQSRKVASGDGYRDAHQCSAMPGEEEPVILLPKDGGQVPSFRMYKGGDRFYCEAFVELKNTSSGVITLTAKTGYMMKYPFKSLAEDVRSKEIYGITFREGFGFRISDSLGRTSSISGNYCWDRLQSSRNGDYCGDNTDYKKLIASGLKNDVGSKIEFDAVDSLNFDKNYTISLWLNQDALGLKFSKAQWDSSFHLRLLKLVTIGKICLCVRGGSQIGLFDATQDVNTLNYFNRTINWRGRQQGARCGMLFSRQYFHLAVVVDDSSAVKAYINGFELDSDWNNDSGWTLGKLSSGKIIVGGNSEFPSGFISDLKIFDRAMTEKEIIDMYRGW